MAKIPTAAYGSKGGAKCGPSYVTAPGARSTGSDIDRNPGKDLGTPSGSPATRASFVQAPKSRA
jgi:hypothetical protein